jgi:WD repeat-containing protein 76
MARQKVQLSEYERKRQENIAKTQALLRDLEMEAAEAGLAPTSRTSSAPARAPSKSKKAQAKKIKVEEVVPRRTSSRLKGIEADSETAKRKAEEEFQLQKEADRAKRQRISDDLDFGDIVVSGKSWDQNGMFSSIVGPAKPYERTFTDDHVTVTKDNELKSLRERMNSLKLWEDFVPNEIKLTPERIASLFRVFIGFVLTNACSTPWAFTQRLISLSSSPVIS